MLLPVLISPRSLPHGFLGSTTGRHAVGRNMEPTGHRRSCSMSCANRCRADRHCRRAQGHQPLRSANTSLATATAAIAKVLVGGLTPRSAQASEHRPGIGLIGRTSRRWAHYDIGQTGGDGSYPGYFFYRRRHLPAPAPGIRSPICRGRGHPHADGVPRNQLRLEP
jgi:hypothetical protein